MWSQRLDTVIFIGFISVGGMGNDVNSIYGLPALYMIVLQKEPLCSILFNDYVGNWSTHVLSSVYPLIQKT
jgi:hypothetical protein